MSRAGGPEGSKVAGDNNAQLALAFRGVRGPWWGSDESVTTLLNYCRCFLFLNNTHIVAMFKKESVSHVYHF